MESLWRLSGCVKLLELDGDLFLVLFNAFWRGEVFSFSFSRRSVG